MNIKYADDPEKRQKYLEYFKNLHHSNKEARKQYKIDWASIPENKLQLLLNGVKYRCKKDGISFDLTTQDLVIPELCPLLGIKLTSIHGQGRVDSNISIDRINSNLGYTKGNVQVLSDLANRMKNSANKEQLISFATNILRIYQ